MSNTGELTVLLVAIGYFLWATWARWRYIALPDRSRLIGDIADVLSLANQPPPDPPDQERLAAVSAVNRLFDIGTGASEDLAHRLSHPKLLERICWSAKTEEEALTRLAAAQVQVPNFLTDDAVDARLVVARGWLTEYGDKAEFVALGKRIDAAINTHIAVASKGDSPLTTLSHLFRFLSESRKRTNASKSGENRALLGQALACTYATPGSPTELIWHRKTAFVLLSGLAAIVILAFSVNAEIVLLFGAVGGMLQRLWQLVYQRDAKSSSPMYWSTLFLAPVAGALAAVGGLYLISLLNITNVLGTAVKTHIGFVGRSITYVGAADIGVAFLLGFSAQLLGSLANRSAGTLTGTSASS